MKSSFLLLLCLLSCGCLRPATAPAIQSIPAMTRHTLVHDGLERAYFVFRPARAQHHAPVPAVVFLHGYGGTATGTEAETTNGFNRYAAQYGYIAIYPQGTWFVSEDPAGNRSVVTSWNDLAGNQDSGPEGPLCADDATRYPCPPECGRCGRCGWTSCHDDLGFLLRLLGELTSQTEIDPDRIYLSGFSNGAMMAHRLACVAGNQLAAVALVGGRLERGYQCAPTTALPLLQINGGRDTTVPYQGALPDSEFYYASAEAVDVSWALANGCREQRKPRSTPSFVHSALECTARCATSEQETVNCLWPSGGHVWPGVAAGHGSGGYCADLNKQQAIPEQTQCATPDAAVDVWGSRLILDFFDRHRRNEASAAPTTAPKMSR